MVIALNKLTKLGKSNKIKTNDDVDVDRNVHQIDFEKSVPSNNIFRSDDKTPKSTNNFIKGKYSDGDKINEGK